MQRKKTFVVVCVSILAMATGQSQPAQTLPGPPVPVDHFTADWFPVSRSFSISLFGPCRGLSFFTPYAVPGFTPETGFFFPQSVFYNTASWPFIYPLMVLWRVDQSVVGITFLSNRVINPPAAVPPIGSDYYTQHFGFFCQKELQLEKMTHIPFRFRLGSLEQTNFLEGK